ncbi:hypothetical protein VIBNIFTn2_120004 [Vibrio nigripulchritudo FTn2]|uniref:3'-5' exonuclease n=1 Tax=Vibrio nigripulchritudo TaxID=28173 RepID=UPI0003B1A7B3|nr:ATP-dependent helicase [Vibrio nigripulchritudo]CCN40022.1 hypothetical protein VIBNIFTn2_120004 [Vibrio nigripulchritudo FTn2]
MIKLADEQEHAVKDTGNSMIIACPGAGKTTVLIQKAIYLIDHCGVNSIHIVTFTRESAKELQSRIDGQGKFYKSRVHCSTLHSICLNHLKKYCGRTSMVSPEEQHTYMLNAWNQNLKKIESINFTRKNNPDDKGNWTKIEFEDFERYVDKRTNSPVADSSGLITLGSNKDAHDCFDAMYQQYTAFIDKEKFSSIQNVIQTTVDHMLNDPEFPLLPTEHLFLDECQDADSTQFKFLAIHTLNGITTTVCGDDDQSLYGFRYALGVNLFKQFIAICQESGLTQHTLTNNFRSKAEIVDACQRLISHNKDRCEKHMVASQGGGGKVEAATFSNEEQQLQEIVKMISDDNHSSSIAILSRTNRELDGIEKLLTEAKIAYKRTDSKGYFESSVCKQYLAILTACANSDKRRMVAALEPMVGSKDAANLIAGCIAQHAAPSGDAIKNKVKISRRIVEALGFAYTNVAEHALRLFTPIFIEVLYQKKTPSYECMKIKQLSEILLNFRGPLKERLSVLQFEKEASQCRVSLISSHGSKGCEFDTVFVINCDENHFPYIRDNDERDYEIAMEEERRLFFVSMSRAINNLYLFVGNNNSSRFIHEAGIDMKDRTYL